MVSFFESMRGIIQLETTISSIDDLPKTRAILLNVTPAQLARMAGHKFSRAYRKKPEHHKYGPGAFNSGKRRIYLFVIDAAWWRGAWHVRASRTKCVLNEVF